MAVSFVENLQVRETERSSDGLVRLYKAHMHEDLVVGKYPFGGYIVSIIVKAAREFVKDTPHPDIIHLTVYFLRACNVGEGEVRIQSVRKSKAFHNLSASLIQAGDVRVSAHMLFGTLSEPHLDATIAPPLTLTPSSSMYRRTPVHEHPATCSMYPLPKFWKFASSTRNGVDMRYVQRNLQKFASKKNDGEDLDMNGVLEVGALLQLVHPNDVVCAETLPIFADMTVPPPMLLQRQLEGTAWSPTMTFSMEFKHRIPREASFSTNCVAMYSHNRFVSAGRYEVATEIWTAPPGDIGEEGAPIEEGWRDKMVPLAVSMQMAMMPASAHVKPGRKNPGAVKL